MNDEPAGVGLDALSDSLDKLHLEMAFQFSDLEAYCRLGQTDASGGRREAAELHDIEESLNLIETEPFISKIFSCIG